MPYQIKLVTSKNRFKVSQISRKITIRPLVHKIKITSNFRNNEGDRNFFQEFTMLDEVTVNHNLGKYPSIAILDSAGDEVVGEVEHVSLNELILRFSAPFTGKVTCN